ncbi:hypothetical protein S83_026578, partial [Arachis hypogaea]
SIFFLLLMLIEFLVPVTVSITYWYLETDEFLHVKPGKGAAFVRTKLKNYVTGNTGPHPHGQGVPSSPAALEPATLVPLQLLKSSGTKCIMVGDPKQLPATVLSNVASKYLYECSMFERLQRVGHPVIMLTEQ